MSTPPRVDTDPRGPLQNNAMTPRKRPRLLWLLVVVMVVVPILEFTIIGFSAAHLGLWPTVGLLLLSGFVGAWLAKHEGSRAWRALVDTFRAGRMPTGELADAALVLVGGVMLMLPGFVSDIIGLLLLLPLTRPLFRSLLATAVARQTASITVIHGSRPGAATPSGTAGDVVVEGEVVEVPPPSLDQGE